MAISLTLAVRGKVEFEWKNEDEKVVDRELISTPVPLNFGSMLLGSFFFLDSRLINGYTLSRVWAVEENINSASSTITNHSPQNMCFLMSIADKHGLVQVRPGTLKNKEDTAIMNENEIFSCLKSCSWSIMYGQSKWACRPCRDWFSNISSRVSMLSIHRARRPSLDFWSEPN